MLKTSAYILLVIAAGTLVAVAALAIPWVYVDEHDIDLRDDLFRSHQAATYKQQLMAYEQVVSAQTVSRDVNIVASLTPPPTPVAEKPDKAPAPPVITISPVDALGKLPRLSGRHLVLVTDRDGKVLGSSGKGFTAGASLAGHPLLQNALMGVASDGLFREATPTPRYLVAASSPVLGTSKDGKPEVLGVVIVGRRLDATLADELVQAVSPERRTGHTLDVAMVHDGKVLVSSSGDSDLTAVLNALASPNKGKRPFAGSGGEPRYQRANLVTDGRQVGSLVSSYGTSAEVGLVLAVARPATITDPFVLAGRAFEQGLPPQILTPVGFVGLAGVGLFIIALILLSFEHNAPGRKLLKQLRTIETDIENNTIDAKAVHGTYRDVATSLGTVLVGLRKRLERERSSSGVAAHKPQQAAQEETEPPDTSITSNTSNASNASTASNAQDADPDQTISDMIADEAFGMDSERTIEFSARNYSSVLSPKPDEDIANESAAPAGEDSEDEPKVEQERTPAVPAMAGPVPSGGRISALPMGSHGPQASVVADSTMDMPADQVAAIFDSFSQDEDDEDRVKERMTREVLPEELQAKLDQAGGGSNDLVHEIHYRRPPSMDASSAFGDDSEDDDNDATRVGSSAEEESDSPEDSDKWRSSSDLTPQSLLGALKKRSVVSPKRRGALVSNEATQVKEVSPDLLRRSSELRPLKELQAAESQLKEYRRLYEEFVATKKECGEDTSGLNFDRFSRRLERNRDKLLDQYKCKSIRFQVYVKKGRAALKATPVK